MTIKIYNIKINDNKMKNNIYIIANILSQEALIVDPAWDFISITSSIKSLNINVKGILLTHHHFDHSNLAQKISSYYNSPIITSKIESDYYKISFPNQILCLNQKEIKIGNIPIIPIVTPGHTKGSVCYLIDKYLLTGDTLFTEGCGICSCHGGSSEEMFYSLSKLKHLIQNDILIYPGHSYHYPPGNTMKYALDNNIYLQINDLTMFERYCKSK